MRSSSTAYSSPELDQIRDDFAFLDHWEDRYRYIIELGDALPNLEDRFKTSANLVHGCMSNAWIVAADMDGRLDLQLDSEARIVRGLIAILLSAVDGAPLDEVVQRDFEALFSELDLLSHLSPSRGNGLRSLVDRVKAEAGKLQVRERRRPPQGQSKRMD